MRVEIFLALGESRTGLITGLLLILNVSASVCGSLVDLVLRICHSLADGLRALRNRISACLLDIFDCHCIAPLSVRINKLGANNQNEQNDCVERVSTLALLLLVDLLFGGDLSAQR